MAAATLVVIVGAGAAGLSAAGALARRGIETVVLEHEYRLLAVRDPRLRARYRRRQEALRDVLAAGLDARAKQLGAPPFSTPSREVATAYLALGSGLAVERLPSQIHLVRRQRVMLDMDLAAIYGVTTKALN